MLINIRKSCKNQKGFTLVELMVVIAILGILAAVAVPRFANSTVSANTSKIAADLRAIDSAISMFQAVETTGTPSDTTLVPKYLAAWPKPPSGKCYIKGTESDITGSYTITSGRAALGTNVAEDFTKDKSTTPPAGGGS